MTVPTALPEPSSVYRTPVYNSIDTARATRRVRVKRITGHYWRLPLRWSGMRDPEVIADSYLTEDDYASALVEYDQAQLDWDFYDAIHGSAGLRQAKILDELLSSWKVCCRMDNHEVGDQERADALELFAAKMTEYSRPGKHLSEVA
jgi:hypothetical protein